MDVLQIVTRMPKNTVFYNWFDYIIWERIVNGVVDGNMCRAFWVLSGSFSGQHWVAQNQASVFIVFCIYSYGVMWYRGYVLVSVSFSGLRA